MARARSGASSSPLRAAASCSGSSGGTSSPVTPSWTSSARAGRSEAMTGRADAEASTGLSGVTDRVTSEFRRGTTKTSMERW